MLVSASVDGLRLERGENTCGVAVDVRDNTALANLAGDVINGKATELSVRLVGNNTLAIVASKVRADCALIGRCRCLSVVCARAFLVCASIAVQRLRQSVDDDDDTNDDDDVDDARGNDDDARRDAKAHSQRRTVRRSFGFVQDRLSFLSLRQRRRHRIVVVAEHRFRVARLARPIPSASSANSLIVVLTSSFAHFSQTFPAV